MVTAEVVRDALKDVQDPELLMGILDLGLVYDVACEGSGGIFSLSISGRARTRSLDRRRSATD